MRKQWRNKRQGISGRSLADAKPCWHDSKGAGEEVHSGKMRAGEWDVIGRQKPDQEETYVQCSAVYTFSSWLRKTAHLLSLLSPHMSDNTHHSTLLHFREPLPTNWNWHLKQNHLLALL